MKSNRILQLIMILLAQNVFGGVVLIQGSVDNADENLQCTLITNKLHQEPVRIIVPVKNGMFHHQFEVNATTLLSFGDGTNYFGGFVEPGDSIRIGYDRLNFDKSVSYTGKGKEKFEIAYSISQIRSLSRKSLAAAQVSTFPVDLMFGTIDSLSKVVSRRIDDCAALVSQTSALQLRGYLAATVLLAKHGSLVALFGDPHNVILTTHRDKLSQSSVIQMKRLLEFDETFHRSRLYVDAVKTMLGIYLEENVQSGTTNFSDRKYQLIAELVPEKLRTPVNYLTLKSDILNAGSAMDSPVFTREASRLEDAELRESILNMFATAQVLKVGGNAPEFSLLNLAGEKISLSSFRGKTIYLDFWFASCGPCHSLFRAIEPVKRHFADDDRVVFLTVSVDGEQTWKKAIARFGVKGYHAFTANQLRNHPMIRSYNVTAYPTTYIINSAGRIHSVRPPSNPELLQKQIEEAIQAH